MRPTSAPSCLQGACTAARSPLTHSLAGASASADARRRGRQLRAARQPPAGPPRRRRPSSLPSHLVVRRESVPEQQPAGGSDGQPQQARLQQQPPQQAAQQQQAATAAHNEPDAPTQTAAQLRPWQQAALSSSPPTGDGGALMAPGQAPALEQLQQTHQAQPVQWPTVQQQPAQAAPLPGQLPAWQQQPTGLSSQPWLSQQQTPQQQGTHTSQWQAAWATGGSNQQPPAAPPYGWNSFNVQQQHQQQQQPMPAAGLGWQGAQQAGPQQQPGTAPHYQHTPQLPQGGVYTPQPQWQQAAGVGEWTAAAAAGAATGMPVWVSRQHGVQQQQQLLQAVPPPGISWPPAQAQQPPAGAAGAPWPTAAAQLTKPSLHAYRQQQQPEQGQGVLAQDLPDTHGGTGAWQPPSSMGHSAASSTSTTVSQPQPSSDSCTAAVQQEHQSSDSLKDGGSALCAAQVEAAEQWQQQQQQQQEEEEVEQVAALQQPLQQEGCKQQQQQRDSDEGAGSASQQEEAAPTSAGLSSRRSQRSLARSQRAAAPQPPAATTPPQAADSPAALTPAASSSVRGVQVAAAGDGADGAGEQPGSGSEAAPPSPTPHSRHGDSSPATGGAQTAAGSTLVSASTPPPSSSKGSSSKKSSSSKTSDMQQSMQLITAISRGQRAAAKAASKQQGAPVTPGASSTASSTQAGRKATRKKLTVSLSGSAGAKLVGADCSSSGSNSSGSSAAGDVVQVGPGAWKLVGYTQDLQDWKQLTPPLQERLRAAITAEQVHEAAALRALYSAGNLGRLQREGLVLVGLTAAPHSLLFSSMVWELRPGRGGGELGYHRFRPGDSVLLSRWTGQVRAAPVKVDASAARDATVLEVSKARLTVALDKGDSDALVEALAAGGASSNAWRLDQSVRDTTARRQLDAVSKLDQLADASSPFETLLRCSLVGSRSAAAVAQMPPSWVRDAAWREDVRRLLGQQQGLNNSQRRAVAKALLASLTLWQGPPGTGKTRTLLALIRVLAEATSADGERWRRVGPILACGDTNAAVDNIVEGLASSGLSVVRLGAAAKVRASVRHLALEALAADTAPGRRAAQLRESSRVLFERARSLSAGGLPSVASAAAATPVPLVTGSRASASRATTARLGRSSKRGSGYSARESASDLESRAKREWAQAEALTKEAAAEVLGGAQVVVATCSGAGDPAIANRIFRMVVIDEASQATEPAVLVPLIKGAQCVVMAGDPRQLPPTILSREAVTAHGLDVTLFERLVGRGLEPLLLDTQYRMHPAISAWPSQWFYQGKLQDGVSAQQKPPAAGFPWPSAGGTSPVALVQVAGREERASRKDRQRGGASSSSSDSEAGPAGGGGSSGAPAPEEASYRNLEEARVALAAMYALLTAGDAQTGAILTPYRGQARALEHGLRSLAPWWEPLQLAGRVSVSSVDAFQGREADVVVLSTVRCNPRGAVGFVADPRRLNVAITRPRRGLVVVGSPATLAAGSPDWKGYITWLQQQGALMQVESVPEAPWEAEGRDAFELSPVLDSV